MRLFDFIKNRPTKYKTPSFVHPSAQRVIDDARSINTDLVIMSVHGLSCPECAKYEGRVFSLSGSSKLFPKIPDAFFEYGAIHDQCGHGFFPYIHGVNDPDLKYTLSIHPLVNPRYGKDIIAFSNRPFEDDRTETVKRKYLAYINRKQQRSNRHRRKT